jgi:hypothetical protein
MISNMPFHTDATAASHAARARIRVAGQLRR